MKKWGWAVYYGKKLAIFLASVLLLSIAVFYISRLAPGDPLVSYYGDRVERMSPAERAWEISGSPISIKWMWLRSSASEWGIRCC